MARLDEWRWSPRPEAPVRSGITVPTRDSFKSVRQKTRIVSNLGVLLAAGFVCLTLPSVAQTDVNDIHVQQRQIGKPVESVPRGLCVDGRERSAVACIHSLQQVVAALIADFPHDDAVGAVPESGSQ